MGAIREVPRDRRRDADAIERSPAAAPSPLAQTVLALQHSAGNAAVQRMLALSRDARADGGGKDDVARLTGHIWLDSVPVGRGEMMHL